MNKIKHVAITICALSAMGIASVSLASSCPTTISPATSTCLSNAADATFQQNYATDYLNQKDGANDQNYQSGGSTTNNYSKSQGSASNYQANDATTSQSQPSYSNTKNNNTNKKPIRWF